MVRVVLSEIPPGAVLAQPVLDAQGRALLDRGSCLTPNVVACLERWGIACVDITGAGDGCDAEALPLRSLWERLFAKHTQCPEMEMVQNALRDWEQRRLDETSQEATSR